MSLHVVVIGAGIVGVSAAHELLRDGHRVTILTADEPGGPASASYGNGAWISPGSVVPVSMPGLWRKIPGYLLDPAGPFVVRPSALLPLAPWLIRFVLAGATIGRVERTARALSALLHDAPDRHAALAAEAGVPDLIRRTGLLYVYPDRAAFTAEALGWRLRRDNGVEWQELDEEALRRLEPALSARYRFGILIPAGAHCLDPGGYVAAIARESHRRGADLARGRATGFRVEGDSLAAVLTDAGEIACDRAVVAAGIGSKPLARAAGDRISLESERGYHVIVPASDGMPNRPVMPSDGKMANTPTLSGLRSAGQVELARAGAAPDWRRADILLAHLRSVFPDLPTEGSPEQVRRWMGHRPSTPDGLPVIGPSSASPDIVYAFGHGHVGLAAGPATGRLVADIVSRAAPRLRTDMYSAARFSVRRGSSHHVFG